MNDTIKWSTLIPAERAALIAEKIFGYRVIEDEYNWYMDRGDGTRPTELPRYSISLDAAWLVVEHVTRLPQSREEAVQGANTQFMLWWTHVDLWACTREAAASEICLAALRACGIEVEP